MILPIGLLTPSPAAAKAQMRFPVVFRGRNLMVAITPAHRHGASARAGRAEKFPNWHMSFMRA